MSNDIQNSLYFQLDSTDLRDLETLLGMIESYAGQSIPAINRILKKLDTPLSYNRIVKTGLSSARAMPLV